LGGPRTPGRISCFRATATGVFAIAIAVGVAACGGGGGSADKEPEGHFDVAVVKSEFPTQQHLGQTSTLKIAVKNTGEKKVPGLTINVGIVGKQGETSSLPFGYHDPQPELAQHDRPVWVLAEGYPQLTGSGDSAGARTSSPKSFDFGPLAPGKTVEAEWKLSAVKAGKWTIGYEVGAGLGGKAKAGKKGGASPGGTISTEISDRKTEVKVTDSGEIVEIGGEKSKGKSSGKSQGKSESEPKGSEAGK
jgi:hypothetical protein